MGQGDKNETPENQMTRPSAHIFHPDCDLCARRKNRLKYALKHLEDTRKRSLDDPALANGFALGGAQRYVDEVRFSHPEHPMNPCPEPEGAQSSDCTDYQNKFEHQIDDLREPKSAADQFMKSTTRSHKTKAQNPLATNEPLPPSSQRSHARLKPDENDETLDINSEYTLKTSFLKQQDIVERMMDLEKTLGIIVPGGHKYVDALRKLAVAILRQELQRPKKSRTTATD
jgi:hypothetical protein